MSILVEKIFSTEKTSMDDMFSNFGRIYTFLNPVSYLYALENKDLFAKFDGIFADGSILVAAINCSMGTR